MRFCCSIMAVLFTAEPMSVDQSFDPEEVIA
jgi:hypothetical protein